MGVYFFYKIDELLYLFRKKNDVLFKVQNKKLLFYKKKCNSQSTFTLIFYYMTFFQDNQYKIILNRFYILIK